MKKLIFITILSLSILAFVGCGETATLKPCEIVK